MCKTSRRQKPLLTRGERLNLYNFRCEKKIDRLVFFFSFIFLLTFFDYHKTTTYLHNITRHERVQRKSVILHSRHKDTIQNNIDIYTDIAIRSDSITIFCMDGKSVIVCGVHRGRHGLALSCCRERNRQPNLALSERGCLPESREGCDSLSRKRYVFFALIDWYY